MSRADVSEADLLRAFAALRDPHHADELAAEALGFHRVAPPSPAPASLARRGVGSASRGARPKPQPQATPEPAPPEAAPCFWRLASDLPNGPRADGAPAWMATQTVVDDRNVEAELIDGIALQPLTAAHRFATFIRRHLAVAMRSAEPDTGVAVQRIARGETLADCPALVRKRWPGGVHLVFDASPHLWPLAVDLGVLAHELERLLGHRLRLFRCSGLPGAMLDADMRAASVPADGAPVVVLGDAGMLASDARRQRAWVDWGLRQQKAGRRALLLAPVPVDHVGRKMAQAFDVVPLGQAGGLRWAAGGRGSASASTAAPALQFGEALLRDLLFGNSYVEPALLRRLRRLLNANGHALTVASEVAVWRHPGVVSDPGGCALHPAERDATAQRLAAVDAGLLLAALAEHWDALRPASPLVRAEFAVWWNRLLEQRGEAGPWRQVIGSAVIEGGQLMRSVATAMWTLPPDRSPALAAYLRRFGARSAELLGASDGHQLAWTLAQREAIEAGAVPIPGSVELATVQWVFGESGGGVPMNLIVQGVGDWGPGAGGGQARLAWADPSAPAGVALARAVEVGRLWTVHTEPVARQRTLRWVDALVQTLQSPSPAEGAGAPRQRIADWLGAVAPYEPDARSADERREQAEQHRNARDGLAALLAEAPADALALERLAHELHGWLRTGRTAAGTTAAQPADVDELPAMLAQALPARDLQAVTERVASIPQRRRHLPRHASLTLPVDARCTLTAADRTLAIEAGPRPAWADAVAFDGAALRATLADGRERVWVPATEWRLIDPAEGAVYRLPQGCWWDAAEFHDLVGSTGDRVLTRPTWASRHGVDEHGYWAEFTVQRVAQRMRFIPPARFWMGSPLAEAGRDDNESLHPVTLTHGFWLADTACTQALWRAVTGELPEGQRGDGPTLPVVSISHDDITGRFLPTLDRHVPGFSGRLPSEAEWEYAARAATVTAYPWGDRAEAGRMNFDMSAADAILPVTDFPANPWGLYQMHGNVNEWCADWFAPYPGIEVDDPAGPSEAPTESARRVLRGGAWIDVARRCRSGDRGAGDPGGRNRNVGFRLARGLPVAGRAEPGGRGAPAAPAEPAVGSDPGGGAPGSRPRAPRSRAAASIDSPALPPSTRGSIRKT